MFLTRHRTNFTLPRESNAATLQCGWLGRAELNGLPSCGLEGRQWWAKVGGLQVLLGGWAQTRVPTHAAEYPTNGPPTCPWVVWVQPACRPACVDFQSRLRGSRDFSALFWIKCAQNVNIFKNKNILCTLDVLINFFCTLCTLNTIDGHCAYCAHSQHTVHTPHQVNTELAQTNQHAKHWKHVWSDAWRPSAGVHSVHWVCTVCTVSTECAPIVHCPVRWCFHYLLLLSALLF